MARLTEGFVRPSKTPRDYGMTSMPDFNGARVSVLPGAFHGSVVALMASCNCRKAESIEQSDIIVFTGGSDIEPSLYDEAAVPGVYTDPARDTYEVDVYKKAVAAGIPMFGICRGAQFLHAMNGGKLWQDVNNHGGGNHEIVDVLFNYRVDATSIHHQMLQFHPDMVIVAVAENQVATKFQDASTYIDLESPSVEVREELEIEAGAYEKTKCFFVQGHPEIGNPYYQSWTMNTLQDYLQDWDIESMRTSIVEGKEFN